MIGIIDYGSGNVAAFANAYRLLDIPARAVRSVDDLNGVSKIIIPGVGAFDHAMECLRASGMRESLDDMVLRRQVPTLGVCVGMQMFARSSEEGTSPGLNWINGQVRKFDRSRLTHVTAVPHMGWNDVRPRGASALLKGLESEARFYFLHSYYVECESADDVIAVTDYGGDFACAVQHGAVFGVQFHPEKSHRFGIQLLRNFAEIS